MQRPNNHCSVTTFKNLTLYSELCFLLFKCPSLLYQTLLCDGAWFLLLDLSSLLWLQPTRSSLNFLVLDFFLSPVGIMKHSYRIRDDVHTTPSPALSCPHAQGTNLHEGKLLKHTVWPYVLGFSSTFACRADPAYWWITCHCLRLRCQIIFTFYVFCMLFVSYWFLQSVGCLVQRRNSHAFGADFRPWSHFSKCEGLEIWWESAFT